ncbi:unnamed protein product [Eretmochelys imbricata]
MISQSRVEGENGTCLRSEQKQDLSHPGTKNSKRRLTWADPKGSTAFQRQGSSVLPGSLFSLVLLQHGPSFCFFTVSYSSYQLCSTFNITFASLLHKENVMRETWR